MACVEMALTLGTASSAQVPRGSAVGCPATRVLRPSTQRVTPLRSRTRVIQSARASAEGGAEKQEKEDSMLARAAPIEGPPPTDKEPQRREPQQGPFPFAVGLPSFALVGSTAVALALAASLIVIPADSAFAADPLKTCACLLENCRGELLRCLGDVKCAANIACLQACNGRPDETECQIGCGDLFANSVVDRFNLCAVSEKGCVPQKPDENLYPVPKDEALVPSFDVASLKGDWYISAGQNPTFDTFDCQLHTFQPTAPDAFAANLTWRIRTPDGGFFTRSAVQEFVQEKEKPALLLNHDNEFLHYQDDWYVISSKMDGTPEDYFLVYYRGKNDAWDGYGGAVLYTRSKTMPPSILPEVRAASRNVGLDFDNFIITDNTCGAPQPLLARLEKTVEEEVVRVENEVLLVENRVVEAGKEELRLLASLGKGLQELQKDKDIFLDRLSKREKELLERMESAQMGGADDLEDLFGNAIPLRTGR